MLASREALDLEDALNREGKNGWWLRETIILIVEQEKP